MSAPRIFVTALAGDFGQAIVKALALADPPMFVAGGHLDADGIGRAFVADYAVLPVAADPDYVIRLDEACRRLRIDAVIPASEAEIAVLTPIERLPSGAVVVAQAAPWFELHRDKLASFRALRGFVPLAPFADADDRQAVESLVREAGYPIVVKPRRSSGSKSIAIARDAMELADALARGPGSVAQAWLDDTLGEFSIGVFAAAGAETAVAFRRELGRVGCTWFAETSDDAEVLQYARDIARATRLVGSANVQVRKTAAGVRLLEINPRFSSLVAARAACGFRDAEWSVALALGGRLPAFPASYRHLRFHRFFHELIDTGDGYRALDPWAPATQAAVGAMEKSRG